MLNDEVKVYDNIFHSYRSGDMTLQSENNVTKVLINVFQHSHKNLVNNFIKDKIGISKQGDAEEIIFDLQIKKQFNRIFKKAIVIGIAGNKPTDNVPEKVDQLGVADAAIISKNDDFCILMEVKLDKGQTKRQMKKHENLFFDNQLILDALYLTWDDIILFMKEQLMVLKGSEYCITTFLINQFLGFCNINGLGKEKSKEYYFQCFPLENRELVREIDKYIVSKYANEFSNKKSKSAGISYTRKNRSRFFVKIDSRMHALLLSFKDFNRGREIQEQLKLLSIAKEKSVEHTSWEPAYQAWINLKSGNLNFVIIKDLIDIAFIETT